MEEQGSMTKRDWRKQLLSEANDEWKDLEKILLAVVGGTLAGSITFLTAVKNSFSHQESLALSWAFLCLSLIALLVSYIFSEIFSILKLWNIKRFPKDLLTDGQVIALENKALAALIVVANWSAVISAIVGIILLARFGYYNLNI